MKNPVIPRVLLTILVFAVITGSIVLALRSGGADAGAPPAQPQAMPVSVMVVKEKPVQVWKEFPGRLNAVDSVEIRPQVSGTIQSIKFEDGEHVLAGQELFLIDPRPYEAAVAQAKADLAVAKNQSALAWKEFARAKDLVKSEAIPKRTYDERQSNSEIARSAVSAAEAKLARAELDLNYAHLKAPISGRVSRAEITVGNLVEAGPGAPLLTTIVSSDGIYADFDVDEQTYLQFVRSTSGNHEQEKKIPVQLSLKNDRSTSFEGTIHSFDNRINSASGTIRARALFKNANASLLPGMFATIRIGSASERKSIAIPEHIISTDQDRKFVYVVSDKNTVAYREVALGESVGSDRVITSGLKEGDKVITEGIMKLRPDMPVDPKVAGTAGQIPAQPQQPAKTQPASEKH